MKLGVEKKEERWKMYVLGALVLGGVLYTVWPDSSSSTTAVSRAKALPAAGEVAVPGAASDTGVAKRRANGRVAGDFRPKLRSARPEERLEPTKIDPTIKLMLLARVQNVAMEGGARNIFQFGAATPITPATTIPKAPKIDLRAKPGGLAPAAVNPGPPPDSSAPPIPFKYYGYSSVKGETRKKVFFLDGEEVIVVLEGDMIKNRYKVLHVGLRSVEMEDTQFKNGKQQLPLAEELAG
jgi:hypothetical protein